MLVGLSGPHLLLSPGDEAEFPDDEAMRFVIRDFAIPVAPAVERAVKKPVEKRKRK